MSGTEAVSDDSSSGLMERLRSWVEGYEEAVTNHYSPELRARVHAARINGVSADLKASTHGAVLGHRCRVMENPIPLFDVFDSKILIAATRLKANTALIEFQGKYLLSSQWNAHYSHGAAQPFMPYVLQYYMPKEGLTVCVDARTYGNDARFARRSCNPNAEIRHVVERGSLHLYLVARQDIQDNQEITIPMETANSQLDLFCCSSLPHNCSASSLRQHLTPEQSQPQLGSPKSDIGSSNNSAATSPMSGNSIPHHKRNGLVVVSNKKTVKKYPQPVQQQEIQQTSPCEQQQEEYQQPQLSPLPLRSSKRTTSTDSHEESNIVSENASTSPLAAIVAAASAAEEAIAIAALSVSSTTSSTVTATPTTPVTPVKQRRSSGSGKSPAKSPGTASCSSSSPEDSGKDSSGGNHSTTPGTPDASKTSEKNHKMTREERKILAIEKAFERMEKAAQRRQEMEKKKTEDKCKDKDDKRKKSECITDDDKSSADECGSLSPGQDRSRRRGKKGKGKGTPQKQVNRPDSTASDLTGDESSCPGMMSPIGCSSAPTMEGIALTFTSPNIAQHTGGPFRFPKTKKALMNEWMNETVDPVLPTASGITEFATGVQECYMRSPATSLRRSVSAAPSLGLPQAAAATETPIVVPTTPVSESIAAPCAPVPSVCSAKKRWLRQAISEEHPAAEHLQLNGLCSSPSRPDSPSAGGDYITPLKKRRMARESMSSEQSSTPPSTPVHSNSVEEDKTIEELESEMSANVIGRNMKTEPLISSQHQESLRSTRQLRNKRMGEPSDIRDRLIDGNVKDSVKYIKTGIKETTIKEDFFFDKINDLSLGVEVKREIDDSVECKPKKVKEESLEKIESVKDEIKPKLDSETNITVKTDTPPLVNEVKYISGNVQVDSSDDTKSNTMRCNLDIQFKDELDMDSVYNDLQNKGIKSQCNSEVAVEPMNSTVNDSRTLVKPFLDSSFHDKDKVNDEKGTSVVDLSHNSGDNLPPRTGPRTPEESQQQTPNVPESDIPVMLSLKPPQSPSTATGEGSSNRSPNLHLHIPNSPPPISSRQRGPRTPEGPGPRTPEGPAPVSPDENGFGPISPGCSPRRSPSPWLKDGPSSGSYTPPRGPVTPPRRLPSPSPLWTGTSNTPPSPTPPPSLPPPVTDISPPRLQSLSTLRSPSPPRSVSPPRGSSLMTLRDPATPTGEPAVSGALGEINTPEAPIMKPLENSPEPQLKPAPVKRKLSILEYRKRKSISSEVDQRTSDCDSSLPVNNGSTVNTSCLITPCPPATLSSLTAPPSSKPLLSAVVDSISSSNVLISSCSSSLFPSLSPNKSSFEVDSDRSSPELLLSPLPDLPPPHTMLLTTPENKKTKDDGIKEAESILNTSSGPAVSSSSSGKGKDVKWNAAPTLLERQRENLTARLRREFGLCMSDEDDSKSGLRKGSLSGANVGPRTTTHLPSTVSSAHRPPSRIPITPSSHIPKIPLHPVNQSPQPPTNSPSRPSPPRPSPPRPSPPLHSSVSSNSNSLSPRPRKYPAHQHSDGEEKDSLRKGKNLPPPPPPSGAPPKNSIFQGREVNIQKLISSSICNSSSSCLSSSKAAPGILLTPSSTTSNIPLPPGCSTPPVCSGAAAVAGVQLPLPLANLVLPLTGTSSNNVSNANTASVPPLTLPPMVPPGPSFPPVNPTVAMVPMSPLVSPSVAISSVGKDVAASTPPGPT